MPGFRVESPCFVDPPSSGPACSRASLALIACLSPLFLMLIIQNSASVVLDLAHLGALSL